VGGELWRLGLGYYWIGEVGVEAVDAPGE